MRERLLLKAHAKVNYALEVLGLREDGYHEIRTVMQSISLADEVGIQRSRGGFELCVEPEGAEVGPIEENTVHRARALLREASGVELPVRVWLRKKIPPGAGLGGGSADAAAVLVGMNELFGLGLDAGELGEIGAGIGADVPFCLSGGTSLGEGIGIRLTPLPAPPDHHLVLAMPDRGADTGEIYRLYDRRPVESPPSVGPVVAALRSGDLDALAGAIGNDLEPVTCGLVPGVADYRRRLLGAGALGAAMTGTGTAVYGVFDIEDEPRVERAPAASPLGVYEPVECGVEVL
ncbi:MAG TPA: 4-(cytidine 5'-diphospho)-2-C-methyl-D-erythritol kinase [Rubrobacteraceae bacterium]|nr:4-(cytidine 5'-diphospho)-2-C-methyl-D-erythritol kinase [Rubrobacteraceae bacterium]